MARQAAPGKRAGGLARRSLPSKRTLMALAGGVPLALYAGWFAASVVFATANPAFASLVRPLVTPASSQTADLLLFKAGQESSAENEAALKRGVLPPSVITGIGLKLDAGTRQAVRDTALATLRASPLSSPSVRQLAFLDPDQGQKIAKLELARQITRRDVLATLQMAELQLRRNEVSAGLASLDRALTVSRSVDAAVFPILLGVATTPQARTDVRGMIARNGDWSERMVRWSLANPATVPALAQVIDSIPAGSPARTAGYGQQMIDILAGQGQWNAAFAAYRAYSPRAQNVSDLQRGIFTPLDWRLVDDYDTGGRLTPKGWEIFASPGRQGRFAEIVLRASPGPHRIAVDIAQLRGSGGRLTFEASCLAGTAVLPGTSSDIPLAQGRATFAFAVPAGSCQAQRITLGIVAENEPVDALAARITLDPAASSPSE